ncbi:hypothetical protein Kpol_309p8 [Vanderwaltozyma polyspora DSM 70294]|uniref:ERCC1-like central domain-containing protein n=1 Tax=Vanderwaltozyma polyspora (strain ATCC 22028 / DSM 70294 / BCRC 21397 / CBS 2163 / NBRC 10782 / NRRL Y-8283 / UCD 57-17) TaxID=436907 RepID=A7TSX3_VANPO|nr:uncharacterized protein Kpol_309p8 [Vanderwaltozyma polyspora DSM 70294]EDO14639.1 hypothetical protein Kpol_309p8 [Vanderwaltozyma polyspora DSM 70294]
MNNTDPTSFKSILEGVKRLRKEHEPNAGDTPETTQKEPSLHRHDRTSTTTTTSSSPLVERTPMSGVSSYDKGKATSTSPSKIVNAITREAIPIKRPLNDDETKGKLDTRKLPGKSVLVNTTQKENPLLNHLKNTNWRYISSSGGNKIYYDYFVKQRAVLFLTLSYHKLYADYISRRMIPLSKNDNNVLIFIVDDSNSEDSLREITKMCMFNGFTLLLAFNFEQAAKYIEYLNK